MDFEEYDPSVHSDLVPRSFSSVGAEPDNFTKLRDIIREGLKDVDEVFDIDASFDIVIAKIRNEEIEEGPIGLHFKGFAMGKEVHSRAERDIIFLAAPEKSEYLEPGLKNRLVHEEAHQEFYSKKRNIGHKIWEWIIIEGHAMNREERIRKEKNYQWEGDPREYQGSAEEILRELDKLMEWDGDDFDREDSSSLFSMKGRWEGIGYIIAKQVYSDILSRNNMKIDDPLDRNMEWLRNQVETSVKKIYP